MPPAKDAEHRKIRTKELKDFIGEESHGNTYLVSNSTIEYDELMKFLEDYNFAYTEGYVFTNDEDIIYAISIRNIYISFDVNTYKLKNCVEKLDKLSNGINKFITLTKDAEFHESEMKESTLILKAHFD